MDRLDTAVARSGIDVEVVLLDNLAEGLPIIWCGILSMYLVWRSAHEDLPYSHLLVGHLRNDDDSDGVTLLWPFRVARTRFSE